MPSLLLVPMFVIRLLPSINVANHAGLQLGVEVQYSSEMTHMLGEAAKAGEAQVFAAKNLLV